MVGKQEKARGELALIQLLPNMLTIAAICAGLTAIRFGVNGNYLLAVQLILLAAIIDGVDGRLARAMGSDSKMGAELDSLADFLNFGVTPALILYWWSLNEVYGFGWIATLVYAICCVMRLARFNVSSRSPEQTADKSYFVGIPSPAGALLAMLPLYVTFAFGPEYQLPAQLNCLYISVVGLLMISQIPTWSFKGTVIRKERARYFLVGFSIVGASLLIFPWEALIVVCAVYVILIFWTWLNSHRRKTS